MDNLNMTEPVEILPAQDVLEIMQDTEIPVKVIVIPQIVEEDGLVYEQTNEVGCISRIQTGIVIPEELDELGEVISEKRIEPIQINLIETTPTIEDRVGTLESNLETVVELVEGIV